QSARREPDGLVGGCSEGDPGTAVRTPRWCVLVERITPEWPISLLSDLSPRDVLAGRRWAHPRCPRSQDSCDRRRVGVLDWERLGPALRLPRPFCGEPERVAHTGPRLGFGRVHALAAVAKVGCLIVPALAHECVFSTPQAVELALWIEGASIGVVAPSESAAKCGHADT